jgi:hypothetical protein
MRSRCVTARPPFQGEKLESETIDALDRTVQRGPVDQLAVEARRLLERRAAQAGLGLERAEIDVDIVGDDELVVRHLVTDLGWSAGTNRSAGCLRPVPARA